MTREQILCIDEIRLPVIQEAAAQNFRKAPQLLSCGAALKYQINTGGNEK